jgi:non-specific serine/threonine protein kinase
MPTIPDPLKQVISERYRIEREVGRGGMAVVYAADDLKHGRKVAIKVLHPEGAARIGSERFLREITVAAGLSHPHILPLYDSGAVNDVLYYVMPYIAAGSLRNWLEREKQLPLDEALRIGREIASALGYAHHQGLVHRDIKPENVLISDGIALVSDFGIARVSSPEGVTRFTTAGVVFGTPAYMAPEQAMGSSDIDARADLYSLACVLYEMIGGQPPFVGPIEALIRQHLTVEPRPVAELRPSAPRSVVTAIARGLAKLPSDRFATAARFAEALAPPPGADGTPTPSAVGERAIPHNLPRPRTRFIGRERDLAECARVLGDARVLTITGIGGCGKTRLALQLAGSLLESFPDGAWYADLAPLKDASRVALTVATALDLREDPEMSLLTTIRNRLHDRRALIVLDNCEHVLAAASEVVDALLAASADLQIIVASREGLGIEGERLFALRSMSVPASSVVDLQELESSESVGLFVDRARGLDSRFTLTAQTAPVVVEICRRLDGIPLAIELAAARIKVLKVEDISARLDDRFRLLTGGSRTALARHQTLRATIQWSYDQLAESEQHLLRLLSVFSGGWTLDAATWLAGEGAEEFEVLERMTRLVDKSLVITDREAEGESRYSMLETVRQYAQERLNEAGESDAARTRHLQFYVGLAEEMSARLLSRGQEKARDRLSRERENLLAAHVSCDRSPEFAEAGLQLVGALRRFWMDGGLVPLGRSLLLEALARPGARDRTAMRARALNTVSNLEYVLGRFEDALKHGEESLSIARERGSVEAICDGLRGLAHASLGLGDLPAVKAAWEEFVALIRPVQDPARLAVGLGSLAEAHRFEGNLDAAVPLYEESLELQRARGDTLNVVIVLGNLAMVALERGALERARGFLSEAVSLTDGRTAGSLAGLTDILGAWLSDHGEWSRAARSFGAAWAQRTKIGYSGREPSDKTFLDLREARAREALGEAAFQTAFDEGHALGAEAVLAEARGWIGPVPVRTPPTTPSERSSGSS